MIERLGRADLLAGLSVGELETIAARGELRRLSPQTLFIEHLDSASNLYLILTGKVKVYSVDDTGKEQTLRLLTAGAHLGELGLIKDAVRTASAVTLEETELLILSRRAFVECLTEFPSIVLNPDQSPKQQADSLQMEA